MKIDNYGTGERADAALRLILRAAEAGEIPEAMEHLVLLPIPSTRDGVHISGSEATLHSALSSLGGGDAVVGYGLPCELVGALRLKGALVYDAALDEEFLLQNAELTALGALGYILTSIKASPSELRFGIVGYGRIGKMLLRYLLFFGARVKLFTSRAELYEELLRYGVEASPIFKKGGAPDFSGVDILINTAPTSLSGGFEKGKVGAMRIIELASGNNFEGVEGVEYLPGLPGKTYPKSAGAALFSGIMRFIRGCGL